MRKLILVLGLFAFLHQATAQKKLPQPDDNFAKYLNDGKLMDATGNLKIYLSSFALGFLELGYEQKINDKFSVEVTGSLGVTPGSELLLQLKDVEIDGGFLERKFESSAGFSVSGRAYKSMGAITDMQYRAVTYSLRQRKYDVYEKTSQDIFLTTGTKKLIKPAISLEWSASLGATLYKYELPDPNIFPSDLDTKGVSFFYALRVGVGYYLKY